MQIRDLKLWKGDYDSFPAYLDARWGIGKAYGYRLIQAAEVMVEIEKSPIGDSPNPTTESQTRALASAPEGERAEVWQEAVARNNGEPAPARVVAEVIAERHGDTEDELRLVSGCLLQVQVVGLLELVAVEEADGTDQDC